MNTVDVICEPDNLPRIKLLQSHMRKLQIELVLHEEIPATHSDRLIYVPKRKNSLFQQTPKSADFERIALYLDENTEPIDAEMAVELAKWPGRSSDEAVARLAGYLHRPFVSRTLVDGIVDGAAGASGRKRRGDTRRTHKQTKPRSKTAEQRNNAILATLVLGLLAAIIFTDFGEKTQKSSAKKEVIPPHEILDTTPSKLVTPTLESTVPESAHMVEGPSTVVQEHADHSNPHSTPHTKVANHARHDAFSLCAGANDLLRARLDWEPYTDQNPCEQ